MNQLPILKETDTWLAINKPAGLIVERNPWESPTVEEWVWEYLSKKEKRPFLGIVHRLDRVTSGVLLFAKKKSALKSLNEQFREGRVQKTYLAIVFPSPDKPEGTLTHWLEKDQQSKMAIIHESKMPKSQEVILHYETIGKTPYGALLEIKPQSGKFHQIRAQLAAIGCPIVGDAKYGSAQTYEEKGIALHASTLCFDDPVTGQRQCVSAPPPEHPAWR